jgi:hypothetical protein
MPNIKLVLNLNLPRLFEIRNTGILFYGASTDNFSLWRHVSSMLAFLMLSYANSEFFCLFNNLRLHVRINRFFLHHVKLLERILYGRAEFVVIVKSVFTSRGTDDDCLWGSGLGRGHSENVKKYAEGKERGVTP